MYLNYLKTCKLRFLRKLVGFCVLLWSYSPANEKQLTKLLSVQESCKGQRCYLVCMHFFQKLSKKFLSGALGSLDPHTFLKMAPEIRTKTPGGGVLHFG